MLLLVLHTNTLICYFFWFNEIQYNIIQVFVSVQHLANIHGILSSVQYMQHRWSFHWKYLRWKHSFQLNVLRAELTDRDRFSFLFYANIYPMTRHKNNEVYRYKSIHLYAIAIWFRFILREELVLSSDIRIGWQVFYICYYVYWISGNVSREILDIHFN